MATGREPVLHGNASALLTATIDQYAARSGYVYLTAIQESQIFALFAVLGKPALQDDPRYSSDAARQENAGLLKTELSALFLADDATAWVEKLAGAGVPASAVLGMAQALEQPQIAHRGVLRDLPPPRGMDRPVRTAGAGFQSPHDSAGTDLPPPGIGEHTGAILAELGYDTAQIAALRADAVV